MASGSGKNTKAIGAGCGYAGQWRDLALRGTAIGEALRMECGPFGCLGAGEPARRNLALVSTWQRTRRKRCRCCAVRTETAVAAERLDDTGQDVALPPVDEALRGGK